MATRQEKIRAARKDYEQACASALEEYTRVCASALEEYLWIYDKARAKYEQACNTRRRMTDD